MANTLKHLLLILLLLMAAGGFWALLLAQTPTNPKADCPPGTDSATKTNIIRNQRVPHSFWKPLSKLCDKTGVCMGQGTLDSAKTDAAKAEEARRQACLAEAAKKTQASSPLPAATKQ